MEIAVDFPGGACVNARFGSFTVETDQPTDNGGNSTAPTPFEMFLASLATCAGYYVLEFCKKRGIPADGLRLIQTMEGNNNSKMLSKIRLEIQLPGGFPKQYAAAVIRAAESCLVKKHIENPPAFEIVTSS